MKIKLTLSFILGASLMFICMYDFEQPKEVVKQVVRDTANHEGCLKPEWYLRNQVTN